MSHTDSQLSVLFGAYFHQDWVIEGADAGAVIDRFINESTEEEVRQAKEEAELLLAANLEERHLAATAVDMGLNYLPEADNMTYREWIEFVAERLTAAMERRGW